MGYPRKNQGTPKEFSVRVIDELKDMPSERGDGGTVLRMEAWSVDGKEGQPALAKRDYWNNETGKQSGKAKGLNRSDFEFILKNRYRIGQGFGLPASMIEELIREGQESMEPALASAQMENQVQEAADPWK